jgi:hypothetical protein
MNGYYSIGEIAEDPTGESKEVMGPFGPEFMDLGSMNGYYSINGSGLGDEPSYYKLGYGSSKGSALKIIAGIALVGGVGYFLAKRGGMF